MNKKINITKLPALAVLSAGVVLGVSGMASAAPNREVKQAKKEVKQAKKEVREERKDLRQADTRAERRDAKADLRDARQDKRDAKQDLKREKIEQRFDNRQPNWNNRPNYGYPVYNGGGYRPTNGYASYTGVVTSVKSNQRFTLRVGGQSFDVFSDNNLSRKLNNGDRVQVYGKRSNNNDINDANVSILNNR